MSVLIEIVPGAVDLLPAAAHIAVCLVHVVGVSVAVIEPAGQHLAIMEIVVFIFNKLPTGQHFSIFVEIIPGAVYLLPASPHRPVRAEIVPGAVIHLLPVGKHPSIIAQIIPDRIKLEPALLHHTVLVKIVPVVVDFLPFSHHLAALVEIIPGGSG